MPIIHLTTFIQASVEKVFDLSRSLDLHLNSMTDYEEKIIGGKKSGLLGLNDTVTWQAKHFYKSRTLQIKLTALEPYSYFRDEQIAGDFKKMIHHHYFKPCENGTILIDYFDVEAPYGVIGKLFERFWLLQYMTELLSKRNAYIKQMAEKTPPV